MDEALATFEAAAVVAAPIGGDCWVGVVADDTVPLL